MGKFIITRESILRSKVFPQDWYPVEVVDYECSTSKAGDSLNHNLTFKILAGEYKDGLLYRLFSEKAPGFAIPFFEALGVTIPEEGGEFDFEACKGRRLQVYNKQKLFDGSPRNNVEGFRPI